MTSPSFLDRGDGTRLAYRFREGSGPAIVFLSGYASDMEGTKATALDRWAAEAGRPMLRLDYTGCGASEGAFETGTLARWRDDVIAFIDAAQGPVVLVGSSMGGWLMLLVALARPDRVAALVGIAAAPDFTDWGYSQEEKLYILQHGRLERPSDHGDPMVTTRAFWQSAEALRLLQAPIAIDCPVRLIHGQADIDVPWGYAVKLMDRLRSADVQLIAVKDGGHRLSRPQDLALLTATLDRLLEAL